MIRQFQGKRPYIAKTAYVSEAATLIGDINIGEGSSVWPGAVIRADFAPVRIGSHTHVEDNAVVHNGKPLTIGDNVFIGHGVVIHGKRIGNNVLIGNGAVLLENTEIGDNCIVSAGSIVPARTIIPDNSFVEGYPARIIGSPTERQRAGIAQGLSQYDDLVKAYLAEQG